MTLTIVWLSLLPRLGATGPDAEITSQLVAPLVGGVPGSFLMERLIYPMIFYLAKR